jgi:hypothetical protein
MTTTTPSLRSALLALLLPACAGTADSALEDTAASEFRWQDADGDGYVAEQDCDDDDATSYPGGTEYCDGADNDCDGVVDDGALDAQAWYADDDGDGFGDPQRQQLACRQPSGWVGDDRDCDDDDPSVHPEAEEASDGVDNDCDGSVDELGGQDIGTYGALEVDNASDWWTGGSSGASAGGAVAGGLDLTGDGTDDLLLSAPGAATGGEFYLLRGEDLGSTTGGSLGQASVTGGIGWQSPSSGDAMGASLTLLPDVDGDGSPDLAVGSPGQDDGATDTGTVILYFSSIDAYYFVNTSAEGARLGVVAHAGDTDRDGLSDILVGAPGLSSSQSGQGFAELLLGDRDQMVTVGAYWVGDSPNDSIGDALGTAGDLDGDGLDELVVAGSGFPAGSGTGAAWIFMGRQRWPGGQIELSDADHQLMGARAGDRAGAALAGGRDFDGDGYEDLVVSTPGASASAGAVTLWTGAASWGDWSRQGTVQGADVTFTGEASGDEAGSAIDLLEDFDGDGLADLAVGAPGHSGAGSQRGRVYLLLGAAGAWSGNHSLAEAAATWTGEATGDALGAAVGHAGDANADGRSDLIMGAPGADHDGSGSGAVYLILGR